MEEENGIGAGYIVLIVVGLVVIIAAVGGLWYMDRQSAPEREAYASLAQCLSEREVKFYGAFWCPNCGSQKALFKGSGKSLPYIECSLPDKTQIEMCEDEGIGNYPTWEFDGNKRCVGTLSPEVLAHLSGCPLPAYGEKVYTIASLREQLIDNGLVENLKRQRHSESDILEFVEEVITDINTYLTENYQTTLEETDKVEYFLAAFADTVHSCEPYGEEDEEGELSEEGVQ